MELFKHQKEGIYFLRMKKRAILADEMGLGKTRQAIMAAGPIPSVTLVICPASLKINWEREIKLVYPTDVIQIVNGWGAELAEKAFKGEARSWVIINYDILIKHPWLEKMVESGDIGTLVLDEAHYIKGKTIRAKAALVLAQKVESVYCLTGTPLLNRPIEMFNMLKAVKHPLGKARTTFAKRYCGGQMKAMVRDLWNNRTFFVDPKNSYPFRAKKDQYRVYTFLDDTGATHIDELHRFTADVLLRREKKEVLDLPEKIVQTQECDLSDEDWKRYDEAWETYLSWIEQHPDGERDVENIKTAQQLIELGKLKQVCSLAKVSRIIADVENAIEQGEKVIIFSQYTRTIEAFAAKFGKECVTLTGADDSEDRQEAVDRFQTDPAVKVFIANIKAGGIGITLTAASIVMFADFDWSPKVNEQAEDRAHRIGQTGTVNVYYYVTKDTVEKDIMEVLRQKNEVISAILGERAELST